MAKKPTRTRSPKDAGRKIKKKTSILQAEKVEYVDYKDVNLLNRFVSDRSKIRGRRVNGNDVQQQRDITTAIKIAREMALIPYSKRVASAGRPPRRGRDEDGRNGSGRDTENDRTNDVDTELDDQVEASVESTDDGEEG